MPSPSFKRFRFGESGSNAAFARHWNNLLEVLDGMRLQVSGDLTLSSTPQGTLLGVKRAGTGEAGFTTDKIRFGKPDAAFTTGDLITLVPCAIDGVDTDEDDEDVWMLPDQSEFTMPHSTTIATTMIVPFMLGSDGEWYVFGTPVTIMSDHQFNTTTGELQNKYRVLFVPFAGTVSDWVDATADYEDC